jgi:hypothetical protein
MSTSLNESPAPPLHSLPLPSVATFARVCQRESELSGRRWQCTGWSSVSSKHSRRWHYMEVNTEFQAPATLSSRIHPFLMFNWRLCGPHNRFERSYRWKYSDVCREQTLEICPPSNHCASWATKTHVGNRLSASVPRLVTALPELPNFSVATKTWYKTHVSYYFKFLLSWWNRNKYWTVFSLPLRYHSEEAIYSTDDANIYERLS